MLVTLHMKLKSVFNIVTGKKKWIKMTLQKLKLPIIISSLFIPSNYYTMHLKFYKTAQILSYLVLVCFKVSLLLGQFFVKLCVWRCQNCLNMKPAICVHFGSGFGLYFFSQRTWGNFPDCSSGQGSELLHVSLPSSSDYRGNYSPKPWLKHGLSFSCEYAFVPSS